MSTDWTPEEAELIGTAQEIKITTRREDGTLRGWVPIWVVCVGDRTFVRTWHRRESGWFGRAVAAQRARIRVPGLERDVTVVDLRAAPAEAQGLVSEAYRTKYARCGAQAVARMAGGDAVASTLQLLPEPVTKGL